MYDVFSGFSLGPSGAGGGGYFSLFFLFQGQTGSGMSEKAEVKHICDETLYRSGAMS